MAWSWSTFNAELSRVLDDTGSTNPAHNEDVRLDGLNAALRAMMAYHPLQAKTSHSGVSQITVPSDCYRIEALLEEDSEGNVSVLVPTEIGDTTGYWVWNGIIYLPEEIDVIFYYQSYYPVITKASTNIPVPDWARNGVLYRTAAHCLVPNQVSRARLGAYHDRQDSNPLDNSLIQSANWLISEFERVMTEHKHAL